jgi:hypothetical protein
MLQYYHRCYLMSPTPRRYVRTSLQCEYYGSCECALRWLWNWLCELLNACMEGSVWEHKFPTLSRQRSIAL